MHISLYAIIIYIIYNFVKRKKASYISDTRKICACLDYS